MNWSMWIRQGHRWLSMIFTATVIANFVAMTQGEPPAWIVYSPLLPLFLLLGTGLYMFVLPYATGWRGGRSTSGAE
jgi:hypothetical protein